MKRNVFYLLVTIFSMVGSTVILIIADYSPITIAIRIFGGFLVILIISVFPFLSSIISMIAHKTWERILKIGLFEKKEKGMYMTGVGVLSSILLCIILTSFISGNILPELRGSNALKYITTVDNKIKFLELCVTSDSNAYKKFAQENRIEMIPYSFTSADEVIFNSIANDPSSMCMLYIKYGQDEQSYLGRLGLKGLNQLIDMEQTKTLNYLLRLYPYQPEKIIPYSDDVETIEKYASQVEFNLNKDVVQIAKKRLIELKK